MLLARILLTLIISVFRTGRIYGAKIDVTVQGEVWQDVHWWNISQNDYFLQNQINLTVQIYREGSILEFTQSVLILTNQTQIGYVHFTDCRFAGILDVQLLKSSIPHVLVIEPPCFLKNSESRTFQLFTNCHQTAVMMADVVVHLSWTSVIIFFDDHIGDRCIQELLMQFSSNGIKCQLANIDAMIRDSNIDTVKRYMRSRILVLASREKTQILLQAYSEKTSESTKYWVIYMYDLHGKPITEINSLRNVLIVDHNRWGLTNVSDTYAQVEETETSIALGYLLAAVEILQNSSAGLGGLMGNDGFQSREEYRFFGKSNNLFTEIGMWNNVDGLSWQKEKVFDTIFTDFGNKHLKIATLEARPFTIKNGNETDYVGFCFDILNELAKGFKFSYAVVEPPDGLWGSPNPDGTWNGMVGMVKRGEVDFAVGPFTITSLRETVIDFTTSYMEDGAGILTKRPTGEDSRIFKMFKPFSDAVWISIAIAIIVVGVMLYISNRLSPFTAFYRKKPFASKDEVRLSSCLWLIYGSFMEQGGEPHPSSFSGRCILGFWWIFTILITSTYTANLAAFLTVSIAEKPINSLKELVAQDELQPLVKIGTNLHSLFQKSEGGIYGDIWQRMSNMPEVRDSTSALSLVRNSFYAFMTDRSQLEYVMLQDCETYALADEVFNTAGYGFVLPERAPFLEAFDKQLMRMQEAGLMEKWRKKWWSSNSDVCTNSGPTSSAKALGLDSLSGLFFFYAGVMILSFISLIVEICVLNQRCKNCKSKIPNSNGDESEFKLQYLESNSESPPSKETNGQIAKHNQVPNGTTTNHISSCFNPYELRS